MLILNRFYIWIFWIGRSVYSQSTLLFLILLNPKPKTGLWDAFQKHKRSKNVYNFVMQERSYAKED